MKTTTCQPAIAERTPSSSALNAYDLENDGFVACDGYTQIRFLIRQQRNFLHRLTCMLNGVIAFYNENLNNMLILKQNNNVLQQNLDKI